MEKQGGSGRSNSCPISLSDVDLFREGAQEHWYDAYPILHAEAPVMVLEGEGPADSDVYVLSSHADIETVVKDPRRFLPGTSQMVADMQGAIDSGNPPPDDASLFSIAIDSMRTLRPTIELWRTHRQELTDPWVGPGAKRHTEMIHTVVDELIDQWIDRNDGDGMGTVEFIDEFARPLPQIVMANVLGFPRQDVPKLAAWGTAQVMQFVYGKGPLNILSEEQSAEQAKQLAEFPQYIFDHVEEKRARPKDDMISALTQAHYQALDRKLTDREVIGIVYLMILGGLETTQYAIEEQAQLLCDEPKLFNTLQQNPDKIRAFTEESMRLRAPTQGLTTRMTTQEEVFQGVTVPAGSMLHLRFGAGNVDPEQYDCPYQLNLERKALGNHLTFSQGPRTCPGAGISRLEQQIAWQHLFKRLQRLEYAEGNTFKHQPGIMLGTLALSLRFQQLT